MKTVTTILGHFDTTRAKAFKKAYEAAKGRESFMFTLHTGQEAEVLVSLAKYFIEFLENEGLLTRK